MESQILPQQNNGGGAQVCVSAWSAGRCRAWRARSKGASVLALAYCCLHRCSLPLPSSMAGKRGARWPPRSTCACPPRPNPLRHVDIAAGVSGRA